MQKGKEPNATPVTDSESDIQSKSESNDGTKILFQIRERNTKSKHFNLQVKKGHF